MRFGAEAQSISLIRIQLETRYTIAAAAATMQIPSGADAIIKYGSGSYMLKHRREVHIYKSALGYYPCYSNQY